MRELRERRDLIWYIDSGRPLIDALRLVVSTFTLTTVTSNNNVVSVASASDVMQGHAILGQDAADTAVLFETAADSDTITMNGSTKGGIVGDLIELVDADSGFWQVRVMGSATGTEATPFSAAVS